MFFEDLHPDWDYPGVYEATNERVDTFRELLRGRSFGRVGGICSGGEMAFFSLLPRTRQELYLVDQSYGSLYYAMLKYLLLREYGWKQTYEWLTGTGKIETLIEALQAVDEEIPASVKSARGKVIPSSTNNPYYRNRFYNSETISGNIQSCWRTVSPRTVQEATRRLHRVKFFHGDLRDMEKYGPFDAFYFSNALTYSRNRDSLMRYKTPGYGARKRSDYAKDVVRKLVKGGGVYLLTHHYLNESLGEEVKPLMKPGAIPGSYAAWYYNLSKVPVTV